MPAESNQKKIKIIQLSDCHLMADRNSQLKNCNTFNSLQNICAQISSWHKDADLILLSGDISQDGSIESYRWVNSLLNEIKIPCIALPGNHDHYINMQSEFHAGLISCDKKRNIAPWQILLLDSSVDGAIGGKLGQSEITWLAEQLNQSADTPTLIALHHPPLKIDSQWLDAVGLENPSGLMQLVAQHSHVKMVLFGHIHQVFFRQIGQALFCSAPATCRQFKPKARSFELDFLPPGYRVLELFANGCFKTYVEFLVNTNKRATKYNF